MAQPKSSATNRREGHVRNRGQHKQRNIARAKIIYDINYCKRRAQWRPKESAINRARGRARRRPNHSTNGVVGGANELTNWCKGGARPMGRRMMMPDDAKSAQTMAEGARWCKAPDDDANRPKRGLRARDGRPKRWHEGQLEDESAFSWSTT